MGNSPSNGDGGESILGGVVIHLDRKGLFHSCFRLSQDKQLGVSDLANLMGVTESLVLKTKFDNWLKAGQAAHFNHKIVKAVEFCFEFGFCVSDEEFDLQFAQGRSMVVRYCARRNRVKNWDETLETTVAPFVTVVVEPDVTHEPESPSSVSSAKMAPSPTAHMLGNHPSIGVWQTHQATQKLKEIRAICVDSNLRKVVALVDSAMQSLSNMSPIPHRDKSHRPSDVNMESLDDFEAWLQAETNPALAHKKNMNKAAVDQEWDTKDRDAYLKQVVKRCALKACAMSVMSYMKSDVEIEVQAGKFCQVVVSKINRAKTDLKVGDIVIEIDKVATLSVTEYQKVLESLAPGKISRWKIRRRTSFMVASSSRQDESKAEAALVQTKVIGVMVGARGFTLEQVHEIHATVWGKSTADNLPLPDLFDSDSDRDSEAEYDIEAESSNDESVDEIIEEANLPPASRGLSPQKKVVTLPLPRRVSASDLISFLQSPKVKDTMIKASRDPVDELISVPNGVSQNAEMESLSDGEIDSTRRERRRFSVEKNKRGSAGCDEDIYLEQRKQKLIENKRFRTIGSLLMDKPAKRPSVVKYENLKSDLKSVEASRTTIPSTVMQSLQETQEKSGEDSDEREQPPRRLVPSPIRLFETPKQTLKVPPGKLEDSSRSSASASSTSEPNPGLGSRASSISTPTPSSPCASPALSSCSDRERRNMFQDFWNGSGSTSVKMEGEIERIKKRTQQCDRDRLIDNRLSGDRDSLNLASSRTMSPTQRSPRLSPTQRFHSPCSATEGDITTSDKSDDSFDPPRSRGLDVTKPQATQTPIERFRRRSHQDKAMSLLQRQGSRSGSTWDRKFIRQLSEEGNAYLFHIYQNLHDWDVFDSFELHDQYYQAPLEFVLYSIFRRERLFGKFGISPPLLRNYVREAEKQYLKKVPYHTSTHGADVTQATYCIYHNSHLRELLTDWEKVALFLAAAVHDLGHPGVNNLYLIKTKHPLALRYNDKHVLESFHVAAAFYLMQRSGCRLLDGMAEVTYTLCRELMINLVLATDLSHHGAIFGSFKAEKTMLEKDCASSEASRGRILQIVIKCADISHPARGQPIHLKWSSLVSQEFFEQGDMEHKAGVKISQMCDRKSTNLPKGQIGFIAGLAKPLWDELSKLHLPVPGQPKLRREKSQSVSRASSIPSVQHVDAVPLEEALQPMLDNINWNLAFWKRIESIVPFDAAVEGPLIGGVNGQDFFSRLGQDFNEEYYEMRRKKGHVPPKFGS